MKKKKKNSPLQINTALIENYKGVNKYTRKGGGTRKVEWSPEMVDAAFKPAARAAKEGVASAYLGGKEKEKTTTSEEDRIKKLEAQIAKLQSTDVDPKDELIDKDENNTQNNVDEGGTSSDDGASDGGTSQEQKKVQSQTQTQQKFDIADNLNENLSVNQEALAGNTKPTRLKVRSVYDKGRRNENVVGVNGQRMTNQQFADSYPGAERIRGGGGSGSNVAAGDYNYSGSLADSPVKMMERSPIQKITDYDPIQDLQVQNPNIEKDVDNYIANMNTIGDEKLDILGAQVNSRVFNYAKQLKDQANMYVDQEGNSKIVNDSINTLKGLAKSVNNLIDKKADWVENNGGSGSTKRMFSAGSSGKNKFMQNAIFMERDDLYRMIVPLPEVTVGGDTKFDDIEFAFGDFKAGKKPNKVVKASEIFKDVFMKPEGKFAEFRKAANKFNEDRKLGKPYNEYHATVISDSLLDSKENILAFAWDNFAGPSFIEQYREANPDADISFADVDSPNFQENKLKDEVSYWLKTKLRREFDSANEKALAFVDTGQMTAQQLLKKYSL